MKRLLFLAALSGLLLANPASGAESKPYPLKTCVVSGEELGTMGKTIELNHEGQQIKLCCKPCVKKFKADPAKYLGKLK